MSGIAFPQFWGLEVLAGLALHRKLGSSRSCEGPRPCPWTAISSPCHVALPLYPQKASSGVSYKDTVLSAKGLSSMTSFKLSCLPQGPVPKYNHSGDQDFNA